MSGAEVHPKRRPKSQPQSHQNVSKKKCFFFVPNHHPVAHTRARDLPQPRGRTDRRHELLLVPFYHQSEALLFRVKLKPKGFKRWSAESWGKHFRGQKKHFWTRSASWPFGIIFNHFGDSLGATLAPTLVAKGALEGREMDISKSCEIGHQSDTPAHGFTPQN